MKRLALLVLLACGFAAFTGCAGYHIGPAKPSYYAKIKTLGIPVFRNESLEPRIESLVTDSVIRQIQQDGTYEIADPNQADGLIEGTIVSITRNRARSVRGNVEATAEFNLNLLIRYKFSDRVTGEILDTRSVSGTSSFFVGNDLQQQERQAVVLAAEDAAIRLTSQISEGW